MNPEYLQNYDYVINAKVCLHNLVMTIIIVPFSQAPEFREIHHFHVREGLGNSEFEAGGQHNKVRTNVSHASVSYIYIAFLYVMFILHFYMSTCFFSVNLL